MMGSADTPASHDWPSERSSASLTNKFIYDSQAWRIRPAGTTIAEPNRRSRHWIGLALALAASAIGFNAAGAKSAPASAPATAAP